VFVGCGVGIAAFVVVTWGVGVANCVGSGVFVGSGVVVGLGVSVPVGLCVLVGCAVIVGCTAFVGCGVLVATDALVATDVLVADSPPHATKMARSNTNPAAARVCDEGNVRIEVLRVERWE
jgi:UDP-3-O-[3-hydroxymyristoyl] glucosamine N-acyltransferase